MTPRRIAEQLSHPCGLLGRGVGFLMNRNNAKINTFALRQLNVDKTERVLEIGFGGGVALPRLIENAGFVAGIDRSKDVVSHAKSRFRRTVAAGEAAFLQGQVEALPFKPSSFEKILTVNTVYFWKSLDEGSREMHRVLVPGGIAVVGFLPKEFMDRMGMPPDIFTPRTQDAVVTAMEQAGFVKVQVTRPESHTAWAVIVGCRD